MKNLYIRINYTVTRPVTCIFSFFQFLTVPRSFLPQLQFRLKLPFSDILQFKFKNESMIHYHFMSDFTIPTVHNNARNEKKIEKAFLLKIFEDRPIFYFKLMFIAVLIRALQLEQSVARRIQYSPGGLVDPVYWWVLMYGFESFVLNHNQP